MIDSTQTNDNLAVNDGDRISDAIKVFLEEKKRKSNSTVTYRQYASTLRLARRHLQNNNLDFFSQKEATKEEKKEHMQSVASSLLHYIGTQKTTQQFRITVLNTFFSNRKVQAICGKENPIPLVKKSFPNKKKIGIDENEIVNIIQNAYTVSELRDAVLLLLFLETDLNATDISRLKLKDIDIDQQSHVIIRNVTLHTITSQLILRYIFQYFGKDFNEERFFIQSFIAKPFHDGISSQGITGILKKLVGVTAPALEIPKLKRVLDTITLGDE